MQKKNFLASLKKSFNSFRPIFFLFFRNLRIISSYSVVQIPRKLSKSYIFFTLHNHKLVESALKTEIELILKIKNLSGNKKYFMCTYYLLRRKWKKTVIRLLTFNRRNFVQTQSQRARQSLAAIINSHRIIAVIIE